MNAHIHSAASLTDLVGSLKTTIGQRLTREFRGKLSIPLIRRALEEAAESAWATDFPHLFFPALAEERVRLVHAAIQPEPLERRTLCLAA